MCIVVTIIKTNAIQYRAFRLSGMIFFSAKKKKRPYCAKPDKRNKKKAYLINGIPCIARVSYRKNLYSMEPYPYFDLFIGFLPIKGSK